MTGPAEIRRGSRSHANAPQRKKAALVPGWPCFDLGAPLVDLTKAMALADELDDQRR